MINVIPIKPDRQTLMLFVVYNIILISIGVGIGYAVWGMGW